MLGLESCLTLVSHGNTYPLCQWLFYKWTSSPILVSGCLNFHYQNNNKLIIPKQTLPTPDQSLPDHTPSLIHSEVISILILCYIQSFSHVWLFATLCDQHARPPCPSPTPGVHPNPCPLSRWCHPTVSSSVIPFSSCPQFFPASGLFQWVSPSDQVAKVLEFQL